MQLGTFTDEPCILHIADHWSGDPTLSSVNAFYSGSNEPRTEGRQARLLLILAELVKTLDALDPTQAADNSGAVGGSAAVGAKPNGQQQGGNGGSNGQVVYQQVQPAYSAAAQGRTVVVDAAPWLRDGLPPPPGAPPGSKGSWGR